jgi:hypothetical protein
MTDGKLVIVPNELSAAINAKLDAALAELPEENRASAEKDREFLYSQLLGAFDEYGFIPDFKLTKLD